MTAFVLFDYLLLCVGPEYDDDRQMLAMNSQQHRVISSIGTQTAITLN